MTNSNKTCRQPRLVMMGCRRAASCFGPCRKLLFRRTLESHSVLTAPFATALIHHTCSNQRPVRTLKKACMCVSRHTYNVHQPADERSFPRPVIAVNLNKLPGSHCGPIFSSKDQLHISLPTKVYICMCLSSASFMVVKSGVNL